ncbi:unnamed protein product [Closterium sp. NIES-54]
MTHGRQPHGCLLPALLTTRSARGGRFGQGGAEARRRHFSRGGVRCGMVWCGMRRRRTLRATSWRGGKEAALQQRCSAVWHLRASSLNMASSLKIGGACRGAGVVLCGLVWCGFVWQGGHLGKGGGGNQAAIQVRGRGGKEAALQARRRHFRRGCGTSGEEAARPARGEAEEREGVVDGLDEKMHDWDAVGI